MEKDCSINLATLLFQRNSRKPIRLTGSRMLTNSVYFSKYYSEKPMKFNALALALDAIFLDKNVVAYHSIRTNTILVEIRREEKENICALVLNGNHYSLLDIEKPNLEILILAVLSIINSDSKCYVNFFEIKRFAEKGLFDCEEMHDAIASFLYRWILPA